MRPSRVRLRPLAASDRDEFVAAMRSSRALHRPWISMPETAEQFAAYLERGKRSNAASYVACRRAGDEIVGFFNISEIVRGSFRSAYLGYGGVSAYAGHGYMTEGMRLLLREARVHLGLHRLEANIQPGNLASIALVRRCGFVVEGFSPRYLKINGRWRDHERWAILLEPTPARPREP
jgi:ribosomal-protein-alanine N-acetyltransferase